MRFLLYIESLLIMKVFTAVFTVEKHVRYGQRVIWSEFLKWIESNSWSVFFKELHWFMLLGYFTLFYFSWVLRFFFDMCLCWNRR